MTRVERPNIPDMLSLLSSAYGSLVERQAPPDDDRARLDTVLSDFEWYAQRLGVTRWELPPRPGRWSFAENLWHITKQAMIEVAEPSNLPIRYFIDHGKEHVGQSAEILALFEYSG